MNIEALKSNLPEHARDIKLNLSTVLTEDGAPDLSQRQIYLIALSSAYATKNNDVIQAIINEAAIDLDDKDRQAALAAAAIMAMNNVYYRFTHLVSDKSFAGMPAKLRMNIIGNPGIRKADFELCCLAVSALNGCGMCMDAHTHELTNSGVSKLAVQSCVRIAAVINAVNTVTSV
ncbi:MAG TPA: carboxymuconolactone decarboxylase family protein [Gammaproteobacteria bacterium]|jgi:alkyl hydroperoxide reductase subunit D|nr:carboxymuconolactone decarboxylase family protein [Gammaproteobacteria bacterium]